MSRVFLSPGKDSSHSRTWSPGDSEVGHGVNEHSSQTHFARFPLSPFSSHFITLRL